MKKGLFVLTLTISLLLVFSVIAAGSSTAARSGITNTDSDPTTNFETDETDTEDETSERRVNAARRLTRAEKTAARDACEDSDNRRERIRCRLDYIKEHKEEFEAPYSKAPEACRNQEEGAIGRCVAFYQKSQACYEKKSQAKNQCFKRLANFAKANLKDETEGRNAKARDYVILLLYDIQEKLEHAIENDRVDVDIGADTIDKIVEIKQDILDGKKKNEVKPKMQELRILLKDLKSTIDEDA